MVAGTSCGVQLSDILGNPSSGETLVLEGAGFDGDLTSDWRDPGWVPSILIAEAYRLTHAPRYVELAVTWPFVPEYSVLSPA